MGKADVFTGMSLTEKLIWLKQIKGSGGGVHYQDHTAEGNPVIFTTNFAQNAKALSASFLPKQDLHGYSKPWVGGAGKNLIDPSTYTHKYVNADGSEGTSPNAYTTSYIELDLPMTLSAKFIGTGTSDSRLRLAFYDSSFNFLSRLVGGFHNSENWNIDTITESNVPTGAAYVRVCAFSGTQDLNTFMLERGTQKTDYEPYENICQITGVNSIDVVANSVTHEFDLGRTVYGGRVSAVDGVLTVTDALIASYNGEVLPSTWISDRDEYSVGGTPTTGAQVVYKLATPLTYQLTAQQIALLEGENVIATDADNLNVTYQVKV